VTELKKVYIEITDVCNLSCSFCHGTKRPKAFMTPQQFRIAAQKVRPFTEYVYLHLMGEPLLHPQLGELLGICSELGFRVSITTNGTLLKDRLELLKGVYKISVSLHSFEANETNLNAEEYVNAVCDCLKNAAANGTLSVMRLWNDGGLDKMNDGIEVIIHRHFPGEYKKNRRGFTLDDNVYLEYGKRFDWPDTGAQETGTVFCMGLRDQAGILCDGTVVPCCLDSDGNIPLGNIFTQSLEEILSSEKAKAIYNGFSEGKAAEELCRHCGFAAQRFGTK